MKQIIRIAAGKTVVREIVLESGHSAYEVAVHADEGATVRLLIDASNSVGTLHVTTEPAAGSRILVGIRAQLAGTAQLAIHSFQWHEAPHAESRIWVRKIVSDEAVVNYQGIIHIAQHAIGTVVSQDDKTLLDGLKARAESQPILEVLTDEVSCSHGSALGRVDPLMVWYMQTRGFESDSARALLYDAFFDEVRTLVLEG